MYDKNFRVICVATNDQLTNAAYLRRLWIAARNLAISRRKLIDQMAATIYDFRGRIIWPNGIKWVIPDIDDLFDIDGRWISLWLEESDGEPKRQPRSTSIEKLRMIDLFFRIRYPDIARHFGK